MIDKINPTDFKNLSGLICKNRILLNFLKANSSTEDKAFAKTFSAKSGIAVPSVEPFG